MTRPLKALASLFAKKKIVFDSDIAYYCFHEHTYLLRFFSDGTVLTMTLMGNVVEKLPKVVPQMTTSLENTMVSTGKFYVEGRAIGFETRSSYGSVVYHGQIERNGALSLTVESMINGARNTRKFHPVKDEAAFDWIGNATKRIDSPFDIRKSSTQQLKQLLGDGNLTQFCNECLKDTASGGVSKIMKLFVKMLAAELPGASVQHQPDDNRVVVVVKGNKHKFSYTNEVSYVEENLIVKDINTILELYKSKKRFFYYWDYYDFSQEHGYFLADKEFGLNILHMLENPPDYLPKDFSNQSCNRIINMTYLDRAMEKSARYFKQLIEDF